MTWASADESERFNTTHLVMDGVERVGSARWYFKMNGYESHHEMSNIWPPIGSPIRERYAEFVIGHAALLGAEFEHTVENGWFVLNHRLAVGDGFTDQAETAAAFLAWKGWWVCFNKREDQWELVKV